MKVKTDFLEGGAVTYVLVDDVKQKQKQKQLCCALLEMSALSLSHNSLLLDGKGSTQQAGFLFLKESTTMEEPLIHRPSTTSSVFG